MLVKILWSKIIILAPKYSKAIHLVTLSFAPTEYLQLISLVSDLEDAFCNNTNPECFFCDLNKLQSWEYLILIMNDTSQWNIVESLTSATQVIINNSLISLKICFKSQLQVLFSTNSLFGLIVMNIVDELNILVGQDIFGPSVPYLQWAYSAVTSNLNGIYLPNSTESFGSIFPS